MRALGLNLSFGTFLAALHLYEGYLLPAYLY